MCALLCVALELTDCQFRGYQTFGHVPMPLLLAFRAAFGFPDLVCELFCALAAFFIVHRGAPFR